MKNNKEKYHEGGKKKKKNQQYIVNEVFFLAFIMKSQEMRLKEVKEKEEKGRK